MPTLNAYETAQVASGCFKGCRRYREMGKLELLLTYRFPHRVAVAKQAYSGNKMNDE